MKKIFFAIIITFLSLNVYADNSVSQTRGYLGEIFNKTTKILKVGFFQMQRKLVSNKEDIFQMEDMAEKLKEESEKPEANPTLLEHAKKNIVSCSYNSQDLTWGGDSWKCKEVKYTQDCKAMPETGELKREIDNGWECYKKGSYDYEKSGWNACDNKYGEHYTQALCMYYDENATDSKYKSYQVDKSLCSDKIPPKLKEQACGPNGAKSTCKCPEGLKYVYENGKSKCKASLGLENLSADMRYGFTSNHVLYWGVIGDNYWKKNCGLYRRYIKFVNNGNIKKIVLRRADFDDYMWIYVNGHRVYAGPYGQGDFVRSLSTHKRGKFLATDGKRNCELSTSWSRRPNVNITPYLKEGTNTIRMDVEVSGYGEAYTEFKVYFKEKEMSPPVCDKK